MRRIVIFFFLCATFAIGAQSATASMLIARDARDVRLEVNTKGMALVTYRDKRGIHRLLAWGAVDEQLKFRLDYSGGWGIAHKPLWKTFKNAALPYDGPSLGWHVASVKAPDGTYWALQSWQRMLPNLGYKPWRADQTVRELRLSHWKGTIPKLEIWLDWVHWGGRFHHLFGRYTYKGKPVFGFSATSRGAPLDPYGRNVYVDTFNSAYGASWKRENSFLTHRPHGNFCYGFYPHTPYSWYPSGPRRPAGHGVRYRATVPGPGVAPDAFWQGDGLGRFDARLEAKMNSLSDQIAAGDTKCQRH